MQEHELVFTKAEYTICEFLALNHERVFSKERILEHVFGFDGNSNSSAITEHVKISVQNSRNLGSTRLKRFGGSAIDGNEKKKTKNTDRAVFEICGVILSGYVRNRNVLSGASGIKSHDRIYAACQLCRKAETHLTIRKKLRLRRTDVEALIPDGCRYGIYDAAVRFNTKLFQQTRRKGHGRDKNGSKYASMAGISAILSKTAVISVL